MMSVWFCSVAKMCKLLRSDYSHQSGPIRPYPPLSFSGPWTFSSSSWVSATPVLMSCCRTASAMGMTMAVVEVLLSHMERKTVQHMKPSTNLLRARHGNTGFRNILHLHVAAIALATDATSPVEIQLAWRDSYQWYIFWMVMLANPF